MTRYRLVSMPKVGRWLLLLVTGQAPPVAHILVGSAVEGSTPEDFAVAPILFEEQCLASTFDRDQLEGLGLAPVLVTELVSWVRDHTRHPTAPLHVDPGGPSEGDPPVE